MKKVLLLFAVTTFLVPMRSALSQTLSDYVKQVEGDTLVIKDYSDMSNQSNLCIASALNADTVNVPAGRVMSYRQEVFTLSIMSIIHMHCQPHDGLCTRARCDCRRG